MFEQEGQTHPQEEAYNLATSPQRLETLSTAPALQLSVARNPATPAHVLSHLASDPHAPVRQAVAGNPNTPWQILEQLAWEFPHEFLHNPAGSLHLLAHPEQVSIDEMFWAALLREETIPPLWWNWLLVQPPLRGSQGVRLHIQYAGETAHPYGIHQEEEEEHTLCTLVELLTAACLFEASPPAFASSTTATQPGASRVREHLQYLAKSQDEQVRQVVAKNPLTPVELLPVLAKDESRWVRRFVAEHSQIPVELLRMLAQDKDPGVRGAVARHPLTPVELLQILAQDQNPGFLSNVREQVARNRQTPIEVLCTLARDENADVRQAVAWNSRTPVEVQQILAQDQEKDVRWYAVQDTHLSIELLAVLALDEKADVREEVAWNPQTPTEALRMLAKDADASVRKHVAGNLSTPEEVLQMLAQDEDADVREEVAGNLPTPEEVLQMLARDGEEDVRGAVAWNPQTPVALLQILAEDEDPYVRWLANHVPRQFVETERKWKYEEWWEGFRGLMFVRKEMVREQLRAMAQLEAPVTIRQSFMAVLAESWDMNSIRTAHTKDWEGITLPHASGAEYIPGSFMPPTALQKLAAAPQWEVRYLVALHENTPSQTRQRLSQDGNRYVRAMARAKNEGGR